MSASEVVVVGGGISGMSFAWFCSQAGLGALVLEKAPTAGGCIQSQQLERGFWFELGAHTCYNSYSSLLGILEKRPGLDKLLPRAKVPFRLYVDGQIRSIPKELGILSLLGSAPRILTTKKRGLSVQQYYSRLVGEKNYERVFGPLFAAVPSQPADDFPADMLFKKRTRRKDVPRSFTLQGGLQSVIDAIGAAPRVKVETDAEVAAIERAGDGFRLRLSDGSQREAKRLALAVPPSAGSTMLKGAFPELADALAKIKVTPIRSIGAVVRADATPIGPVAFIVPRGHRFYSAVSRDTVPHSELRGFAFHLKPQTSQDEALALISEVLKTDRANLQHIVSREVCLPSPIVRHAETLAQIERHLQPTGVFLTGNYFGGLAIEDCVIRSKREAERLLQTVG
ncbi:MAG: protoporphyrinogen/coproporphyrinogen oxidase [Myxococcales bacterium]|jgi:oxygen-dependent protoporphyrinogen oxidase